MGSDKTERDANPAARTRGRFNTSATVVTATNADWSETTTTDVRPEARVGPGTPGKSNRSQVDVPVVDIDHTIAIQNTAAVMPRTDFEQQAAPRQIEPLLDQCRAGAPPMWYP